MSLRKEVRDREGYPQYFDAIEAGRRESFKKVISIIKY